MAVRQETAQLIVEIKAAESSEYQKLLKRQKESVADIKKLERGTDEYNKKLAESVALYKDFSKIDINKLSTRQLIERSRQLEKLKQLLPQNSKALRELEAEQKKINDTLAEARSRTRGVSKAMDQSAKSGGRFLNFMKTALPFMISFFAVGRLVDWGRQLLQLGTEIDVFDRKFRTVFGDAGDIVAAFAETTAISLGLTQSQYRFAAASVGDLLVPMGFQRDVTAQLSVDVVNLSGALSEWVAGQKSAKEIVEIVTKAMLGEREGLKSLGISITEADVKSRLAAKGQAQLTGAALEQAKALVTYELVLEKSKDAQTAFANNSNSLIRKKNELKAKLQENVELLAKRLIPIWNQATVIGLKLVNGVIQIALAFRELPKFVKENRVQLIALGAAIIAFNANAIAARASMIGMQIATVRATLAKKASIISWRGLNAVMKANPIGFIIGLIATLVVGLTEAYKRSETFRATLFGLGNVAKEVFNIVKEAIGGFVGGFKDLANGDFQQGIAKIGDALTKSNPIGIALTQGKRLKEAFNEGFQKGEVDFQTEKLQKEMDALRAQGKFSGEETEAQSAQPGPSDPGRVDIGINPESIGAAAGSSASDQEENALELALAERKAFYERLALLEELEYQSRIERAQGNEELIALARREAEQAEIDNKILHYQDQLALLDQHGESQSNKALEIQAKIAELRNQEEENERAYQEEKNSQRLADLDNKYAQEEEQLKRKFENALIAENEYEELRLQLEVERLQKRLEVLQALGLQETEQYASIQAEKTRAEHEQSIQRRKTAQDEADAKKLINQATQQSLKDTISSAISFLEAEGKERKKQFGITKALKVAQIGINLQSELSGIFSSFSTLGPVGQVLAVIRAGFAIARSARSVSKVKSASFWRGGMVPYNMVLSGQRVNLAPNVPTQPGGDNVLAFLKPGEVVLNQQQQEYFGGPKAFQSAGVPGFNNGGLVTDNTTPTRRTDLDFGNPGASNDQLQQFNKTMNNLNSTMGALMQHRPQAFVSLTDLNDRSDELAEIRERSAM